MNIEVSKVIKSKMEKRKAKDQVTKMKGEMSLTNIADIEGIIAVNYTSISQTIKCLQNYKSYYDELTTWKITWC